MTRPPSPRRRGAAARLADLARRYLAHIRAPLTADERRILVQGDERVIPSMQPRMIGEASTLPVVPRAPFAIEMPQIGTCIAHQGQMVSMILLPMGAGGQTMGLQISHQGRGRYPGVQLYVTMDPDYAEALAANLIKEAKRFRADARAIADAALAKAAGR